MSAASAETCRSSSAPQQPQEIPVIAGRSEIEVGPIRPDTGAHVVPPKRDRSDPVTERTNAPDPAQLGCFGDVEGEKDDPGHASILQNGPHGWHQSAEAVGTRKSFRRWSADRWHPADITAVAFEPGARSDKCREFDSSIRGVRIRLPFFYARSVD
jgi:hypothetical protein